MKGNNIVIEVAPSVYRHLIEMGKLKLGWKASFVRDYINVLRCFKCAQYGHISRRCNNDVTCHLCSENHTTSECVSVNKKCINCMLACEFQNAKYDINHSVFDKDCKCYLKQVNALKN